MALECCADLILKMNDAVEGNMDLHAAMYFNQTFKPQFKLLEEQIHNNWRLHKAYYDA